MRKAFFVAFVATCLTWVLLQTFHRGGRRGARALEHRTYEVAGVVLDRASRPLVGARVRLFREPAPSLHPLTNLLPSDESEWNVVDADGRFSVGPVSLGRYRLRIRHADIAPFDMQVTVDATHDGVLGPLVVGRGATLCGSVPREPEGTWVLLIAPSEDPASGLPVRVDEGGAFQVTGLAGGLYRLDRRVEGGCLFIVGDEFELVEGQTLEVNLPPVER